MSKEHETHTEENQAFWRNAERGRLSRPLELPHTANILHRRITETFDLKDGEKPILTWSIVFDNPKAATSRFVYAESYPEEIAEEDRKDFGIGISRINEYATNYATKVFFKRNADLPVIKQLASAYLESSDLLTYGILLRGTFSRMRTIEIMARHHKIDFESAILNGLFQHDFEGIDRLVAMTKDYTGNSSINGLAVEIGRTRFKKPDLGKWFDKLEGDRNDGKIKSSVKNGVTSVAAMGVFRNPGVIETSGAFFPAVPLINAGVVGGILELNDPNIFDNLKLISQNMSDVIPAFTQSIAPTLLIAGSLFPFVAVHEAIHHYSSNEQFMGYIPAKLIEKEVVPFKARLESEN